MHGALPVLGRGRPRRRVLPQLVHGLPHPRGPRPRGVDLSGITLVSLVGIPGHVHAGNWREVAFVSDNATDEQYAALLDAFWGRLGGPLADLAGPDQRARRATTACRSKYTIAEGKGSVKRRASDARRAWPSTRRWSRSAAPTASRRGC